MTKQDKIEDLNLESKLSSKQIDDLKKCISFLQVSADKIFCTDVERRREEKKKDYLSSNMKFD